MEPLVYHICTKVCGRSKITDAKIGLSQPRKYGQHTVNPSRSTAYDLLSGTVVWDSFTREQWAYRA